SSETRRGKRINERLADTICFACREKGHAAKDCLTVKQGSSAKNGAKNGDVVGICYRCGSVRHTLSKCNKHVDVSNPLPFASCFVCKGQGHLASSCPQNQEKGIYPNGGACKLCGKKTHLAKDCELRKRDNADTLALMGTSDKPGADEDDFHTFRRNRHEIEKEAIEQEKRTRLLQGKVGARPDIVKPFRTAPIPTKKVVFF
ncbi:hypothetical protein AGABI2DRAFT_66090, partial [Agaricus bisporus var. bisporus H97]|uniref:hypothetical protein n=1 Tax=Agaricus bisporus var. bisporus (strain H97 / ATCC MYA-4626 / FGSC 10389) TaxID=936046 RepID=UPI00029F76B8